MVKDIQAPAAELGEVLRGPITAFGERTGAQMLASIARGAREQSADLNRTARSLAKEVEEELGSGMKTAGVDAGEQLVRGIINGTDSLGDLLKRTISRLIQNSIIGVFRNVLGIFSPSRVMEGFGQQTMEGFAQGMRNTMGPLRETSAVMARTPAVAAATSASAAAAQFNVNFDTSGIPAAMTPREAALSAGWQDVIRETMLQLEQGGFRGG